MRLRYRSQASSEAQGRSNHIVVFGGRGFVGSHIIQEALNQRLHVVSVSRSGIHQHTHVHTHMYTHTHTHTQADG